MSMRKKQTSLAAAPDDGSIKVAVRVRPFSTRELAGGSRLIVEMQGATTTVLGPLLVGILSGQLEDTDSKNYRIAADMHPP